MTPGKRRWLERLRDDGPQQRPRFGAFPMAECKRNGWTEGQWTDAASRRPLTIEEVIARKWVGVILLEHITEAGLSALAAD